jgi:hypothetical protein
VGALHGSLSHPDSWEVDTMIVPDLEMNEMRFRHSESLSLIDSKPSQRHSGRISSSSS